MFNAGTNIGQTAVEKLQNLPEICINWTTNFSITDLSHIWPISAPVNRLFSNKDLNKQNSWTQTILNKQI